MAAKPILSTKYSLAKNGVSIDVRLKMNYLEKLIGHPIAFCFYLSYLWGGFIAGIYLCKGCDSEPWGYIVVGITIGILSAITGGFPPQNTGGVGDPHNVWPFILSIWLITTVSYYLYKTINYKLKT